MIEAKNLRCFQFSKILGGLLCFLAFQPDAFALDRGFLKPWINAVESVRTEMSRKPAAAIPICIKDRITNSDAVLQDVTNLQLASGATRTGQSTWQGVDLNRLTAPEMKFLNEGSKYLSVPKDTAYQSCKTLNCIIDMIYPASYKDVGLKQFGIYLRTGYFLNSKPLVPLSFNSTDIGTTENGTFPGAAETDYMFSPLEVDSIYLLSSQLPKTLRFLSNVSVLYRVPPKQALPEYRGTSSCGDFNGCSQGIRLQDGCMSFGADLDLKGHYGYLALTHELGHGLDASFGKGMSRYWYSASASDWKDLSGWYESNWVDNGTNKKYKYDTSKTNFVRSYAQNNPMEDWADHLSYYRERPDAIWKIAPDKAAFLKEKVFLGRVYTQTGLQEYYTQAMRRRIETNADLIVKPCLSAQSPNSTIPVPAGISMSLSVPLEKQAKDCILSNTYSLISKQVIEFKNEEFEACNIFNGNQGNTILTSAISQGTPIIEKAVQNSKEIGDSLQAIRELQNNLTYQVQPRELFISCYLDKDPRSCYVSLLQSEFDRVADAYRNRISNATTNTNLDTEKANYISENSFEKSEASMRELTAALFSGSARLIDEATSNTYQVCDKVFDDMLAAVDQPTSTPPSSSVDGSEPTDDRQPAAIPLTSPFSGGSQYIDSTILNCINMKTNDDFRSVVNNQLGRFGFSVSKEELYRFLYVQIIPKMISNIQAIVSDAAAKENAIVVPVKRALVDRIIGQLTSDLTWIDPDGSPGPMEQSCRKAVSPMIRAELIEKKVGRFYDKDQIIGIWGKETCATILAHPNLKKAVQKRDAERWTAIVQSVIDVLVLKAETEATACIAKYPKKLSTHASYRKACLTGTTVWNSVESNTFSEWKASEVGKSNADKATDVKAWMTNSRTTNKNNAVKAMETRIK